jgi:hypothetical protein
MPETPTQITPYSHWYRLPALSLALSIMILLPSTFAPSM